MTASMHVHNDIHHTTATIQKQCLFRCGYYSRVVSDIACLIGRRAAATIRKWHLSVVHVRLLSESSV